MMTILIKINGKPIHHFAIINRGHTSEESMVEPRIYEVTHTDDKGNMRKMYQVTHDRKACRNYRADGAIILAQKVLEAL